MAIADVSATVEPGSAIDAHAGVNTTSVYTPGRIFPMLPDRLSTDLTSLNAGEDRLAVVVGMTVDDEGAVVAEDVRRALVHNHAQLAYPSVGAWLEKLGPMPPALTAVPGLAENVRLQHTVAQRLRARRHEQGALQLQTLEVDAVFDGDTVSGLVVDPRDRAKELIEDFMIAANGVVARYLAGRGYPVLRRVVHGSPSAGPRIVELADRPRLRPPRGAGRAVAQRLPGSSGARSRPRALPRSLPGDHQAARQRGCTRLDQAG